MEIEIGGALDAFVRAACVGDLEGLHVDQAWPGVEVQSLKERL